MRQHTFGKKSQKDGKEMNFGQNASLEQNPSPSKQKQDAHLRSVSIWTTGLFCSKLLLLGCSKKQNTIHTNRTLVLHHLIAKGWNNECLPLPTRICMCFTGIRYSWMTNWFQQQQRQHAGNTETTQLELTVLRTWLPGLTRRRAASAHRWAALMTSAFRPVMGFS